MSKLGVLMWMAAAAGWAAADPQQPVNINKETDASLPEIRASFGKEFVQVADFGYEAAPVFINTFLGNVMLLERTSDALMWTSVEGGVETLRVKAEFGLKAATLHVELVPAMHGPMDWDLEDLRVGVDFSVTIDAETEPEGCSTRWNGFSLNSLKSGVVHTADAEWNGKTMPDFVMKDIISYYNKYLNSDYFTKAISKDLDVCKIIRLH